MDTGVDTPSDRTSATMHSDEESHSGLSSTPVQLWTVTTALTSIFLLQVRPLDRYLLAFSHRLSSHSIDEYGSLRIRSRGGGDVTTWVV